MIAISHQAKAPIGFWCRWDSKPVPLFKDKGV